MIFKKLQIIIVLIIITISLISCKPEEIILHGDIMGSVTDASTSQPIGAVAVKINNTNDTTSTRNDGTYLLKNITPGDYEVQVSKFAYATSSKNIEVDPAKTKELNFALTGCAVPGFSADSLDFGLDSTSLSFTISNLGRGEFTYVLTTSQDWINVYPLSGEVTDETDNITVSIDKTGLSDSTYEENIQIVSVTLQGTLQDTIDIYLNGVMDIDGNYYEVVQIGTQIWMAENLNVGDFIFPEKDQTNNNIIEKFCYNNDWTLCKTYGGLYQWNEMMQYHPPDSATIGTTQGICPKGWHIPTNKEWLALVTYIGGEQIAGGKLKETGTSHWLAPNSGATNEYGFSALPAGMIGGLGGIPRVIIFSDLGHMATFYTSSNRPQSVFPADWEFYSESEEGFNLWWHPACGVSVRCVKD